MRISEDRYFRDLRPLVLAEWMLRLEARTRTICIWTGLSRDRVRRLAVSTAPSPGPEVRVRHRGRSPHQTSYFFRSPRIYAHAGVLASYFAMVGLVPLPPDVIPAKAFPSVPRGEQLCETYQFYSLAYTDILIDFERAILLAIALAQRDEVDFGRCGDCGALMLIDLLAQHVDPVQLCQECKSPAPVASTSAEPKEPDISEPEQMQLFEGAGERGQTFNGSPADALRTSAAGKEAGSAPAAVSFPENEDDDSE